MKYKITEDEKMFWMVCTDYGNYRLSDVPTRMSDVFVKGRNKKTDCTSLDMRYLASKQAAQAFKDIQSWAESKWNE